MNAVRKFAGLAAVVALTVAALLVGRWFVGDSSEQAGATSSVDVPGVAAPPTVGHPAPAFTADALDGRVDVGGEGQPTWVVFMASWCQECRVEAPDVQAAHEERGDVRIVAVYLGEDEATVRGYADRLGLTFAAVPDPDQRLAARYGVRSVPTHVFIGADGVVRDLAFGALSEAGIREKLDALTQ